LGPFKEKIDDALSLRKAAISIFSACLEKCPSSIDVVKFMPVLAAALGDVEDVQLQAHQIVISLCSQYPQEIFAAVDTFVQPLSKTIRKKFGNKTGTELERLKEWIKSAVRVALVLSRDVGATK
jgi:cullin-associated NEDD8-dissociated protein 1